MSLSPSEQLLYNSTRIEAVCADGSSSFGTGFFYDVTSPKGMVPLLLTNKHVIESATHLIISLHLRDPMLNGPAPDTTKVTISLSEGGIVMHPDDDVDLCAISVSSLGTGAAKAGQQVFYVSLRSDMIPKGTEWDAFDALEDILMVGCPNGLYDEVNGLPVFRRGTTATHPSVHFSGKQEFMIDAACFPGSSGSPVFLYSNASQFDKASGGMNLGALRVKLLGVLFEGPTVTQDGEVILSKTPKVEVSAMMHLGVVLRSTRILELEALVNAKASARLFTIPK